ncbi:MAG: hypothetical protein F6K23_22850 [Okeania sp. SIO2C9]|uniref:hypothetical protein n=1 Tax=Okeania sp. SIO2C9 TaxID=2607791 RepID=UPI0013C0B3AE|nr:hypothetical protein [Okeania sp. SIO2C9]NEQ75635.1 hypothetical protein [Okeania sp. SIO2C9]
MDGNPALSRRATSGGCQNTHTLIYGSPRGGCLEKVGDGGMGRWGDGERFGNGAQMEHFLANLI